MFEAFQKFLQIIGIVNSKEVAEKGEVKTEHLEAATNKIADLESKLATANQTISSKEGEITRLNTELKTAQDATATEKARADKAEADKAEVEGKKTTAETNLQRALDALAGKRTYSPVSAAKSEAEADKAEAMSETDAAVLAARQKAGWKPKNQN